MGGKSIARKMFAFVAFVAIAVAVLAAAPDSVRLVVALIALPVEMFMLATIFADSDRRIPQP